MTLACNTETLGSLYSHALLILTESSKSKNQVVHEQKFKYLLLSSTCWTLKPRPVVLFPPGVTFCYWIFLFSRSKTSDANIGIIANVVYLWKIRMDVACINRDSVDDEAPVMLQFLMKLTWISIRVFYEDTKFTILALLLPPANEVLGW